MEALLVAPLRPAKKDPPVLLLHLRGALFFLVDLVLLALHCI